MEGGDLGLRLTHTNKARTVASQVMSCTNNQAARTTEDQVIAFGAAAAKITLKIPIDRLF
jgi:hypothetical protein